MALSRDQILDAALSKLNQQPTATMAEVAEAVGVGRATLHRHFSSREALVTEIAVRSLDRWDEAHAIADLEGAAASGDAAAMKESLGLMLREFTKDADDFGFILTDEFTYGVPELVDRTKAIVDRETAFYEAAQAAGLLRADLPARWIGHTVFGAMIAARSALRWGDVAPRDLEALVEATVLAGVAR